MGARGPAQSYLSTAAASFFTLGMSSEGGRELIRMCIALKMRIIAVGSSSGSGTSTLDVVASVFPSCVGEDVSRIFMHAAKQ